jgi:hypothetical protein
VEEEVLRKTMHLIIVRIIAISALMFLPSPATTPPATTPPLIVIYANTETVAQEQSFSYTIDVHGSDADARTTSAYLDVASGLTIWRVSTNGEGCIVYDNHAQCVGVVSAGQGMLMFVSVRANRSARCVDYTSTARVDDHLNLPTSDQLTLASTNVICTIMLPLLIQNGVLPLIRLIRL